MIIVKQVVLISPRRHETEVPELTELEQSIVGTRSHDIHII